ncbi:MAG: tRNA 2-thiocytidine biosynthesis TtcA family protein [Defluviitaleaceae bacterium]|nr:tRNA 2-thiocytidine biosynthesis TtcA family protein [Defluviitaleaceae bacterium]MCL2238572.1 tRNA 2-thiocytidine biosynthesis TtcA family protein [Defluviitaleaceae bacterium]
MTPLQRVERSIIKKYRPVLWRPFIEGIKQYDLIQPGDSIAVCISGGKDSTLLAKLMQQLLRYSDFPFSLRFLAMDPGYGKNGRGKIESNAALLEIPVHIFKTDIFEAVSKAGRCPCYVCARMRRGHLYAQARELGCNKIALGHHFSDVVETMLMNMLYGGTFETMMPKLHSQNYPGMELIRPLYRVHEDAIAAWARYNALTFVQCGCPMVMRRPDSEGRRAEVKALIKQLKAGNPEIENRIFQSAHRVNLDTVIGYKKRGQLYNFLDEY